MAVLRCLHVVRLLWVVLCQLRVGGHFLKTKIKVIFILVGIKEIDTIEMQIATDLIAMALILFVPVAWVGVQ